ncbi:hypothetical protein D3C72_685730 [compost metagenome]
MVVIPGDLDVLADEGGHDVAPAEPDGLGALARGRHLEAPTRLQPLPPLDQVVQDAGQLVLADARQQAAVNFGLDQGRVEVEHQRAPGQAVGQVGGLRPVVGQD